MNVDTSQYMSMFLEESMDNLQTLNDSLLKLEQQPDDTERINEIFRVAHTIKGMAATMGFNTVAELTHKMEDVLSEFRDGKLKVTQKVVTVLFKCLDTLETMISRIEEGIEEEVEISDIIAELESITAAAEETAEGEIAADNAQDDEETQVASDHDSKEMVQLNEYDMSIVKQAISRDFNVFSVRVLLSENTLLKSARAFLIYKSLEECGEIIKSVPSTEDIENENFDFEICFVVVTMKSVDEIHSTLVNISEVDDVIVDNVVVETEGGKKNSEQSYDKPQEHKVPEVKEIEQKKAKVQQKNTDGNHKKTHQSVRVDLERLDKFMNMVSELVIHRTRLEQISSNYKSNELNETLEQVARTTSDLQDLVMKIRMLPLDTVFSRFPRMIRDLSVELNKDMELIIQGADTELDRTVIDEIGEPLIHLIRNAADHGIEDRETREARGKDPVGKIKLIAYQEGTKAIIKVEDDGNGIPVDKVRAKAEKQGINCEGMSEDEIVNLIFMQGFSTNEVVTDISGRGVGMDVVKTRINALGGTLDVQSEEGKGSSFIIRLPLTLQIIQALLVKVGSETMAISLGYIDRVIDFKEDMVKRSNNKEVIVYSGNVIPIVRLNERLDLEASDSDKKYVVIVKVGEKTVGLMVDSLLGQKEIVIKPLGKTLQSMREYIGATILGDGLVTLILDVASLA